MKIMVISSDDRLLHRLQWVFAKEPYDYILYTEPQKALDNLTEIAPDLLLFCEDQYPDEAPSVHLLIESYQLHKTTAVVLLSEGATQSVKKGLYTLNSALNDNASIDFLNGIIKKRQNNEAHIEFVFTHPITHAFIMGQIDSIDDGLLNFSPALLDSAASIAENTPIPSCTLKMNGRFYHFPALLTENKETMKFSIDKKFLKKLK